jgi:hypothetical protein
MHTVREETMRNDDKSHVECAMRSYFAIYLC